MSAHPDNPFMLPTSCNTPTARDKKRIDSQAKGKRAERQLAAWWRDHGFPDASRAVKTGDRFQPDGGDLVLQHGDFRLVVEVKHHSGGLTDGQVATYGNKLIGQVLQSKGDMGVLVERRDGVADPDRWWLYVRPTDYHFLLTGEHLVTRSGDQLPVSVNLRTTVGFFAGVLVTGGWAPDNERGNNVSREQ